MNFTKMIIEHLKKDGSADDAKELEEFLKEFEKVTSSNEASSDELEFFKMAMSCFGEEAYNELINFKPEEECESEEQNENITEEVLELLEGEALEEIKQYKKDLYKE